MSTPPMTVTATLAMFRLRYPAVLACIVCALLIATQPASYAKSNLTEADRLAFTCASCRRDAVDADRVAEARRQTLAQNIATGRAKKVDPAPPQPRVESPETAPANPATCTTVFRRVAVGRAFQPGRPAAPAVEQRLKARDRDRAYRQRQTAAMKTLRGQGPSSHEPAHRLCAQGTDDGDQLPARHPRSDPHDPVEAAMIPYPRPPLCLGACRPSCPRCRPR